MDLYSMAMTANELNATAAFKNSLFYRRRTLFKMSGQSYVGSVDR